MNCKLFLELTDHEKAVYMAELIHCCQSDNNLFVSGEMIIAMGKNKGLFENVKIGHNAISEPTKTNEP